MEIWLGVGLHAWCPVARFVAFKEQKCARKYLATIPCNICIYIVPTNLSSFWRLSYLNKTSNRAVTHTSYKMHENRYVLAKSDMHVRPVRFTVLWTPTDSSDKTQFMLYYIAVLVCIIVWQQLNYSTMSNNKIRFINF